MARAFAAVTVVALSTVGSGALGNLAAGASAGAPAPGHAATGGGARPATSTPGYYEVARDGGLFAFGSAAFHGSEGGKPLNQPIVGMATDPATGGYWEVAADGGIFAFTAPFYGSEGGKPLNQPIVGIAALVTGTGYYEVARDGGLFAFGSAAFHGSEGGKPLNQPIVGMATDPATGGYWEVAADGGIFAFTAPFYGSEGGKPLNQPIVGLGVPPAPAASGPTAPAITAVTPSKGSATGGTTVTVEGSGFTGATAVRFGTVPATSFHVTGDTRLTAVAPAGTGTVDVMVVTARGASAVSAADRFTYVVTMPTVASVLPSSATAGSTVTVTGSHLTAPTGVTFGSGDPATTVHYDAATGALTAKVPAGSATGTVGVTVTSTHGTSPPSSGDRFTYVPTITALGTSPAKAGTTVTITGTDFSAASTVTFGSHPSPTVTAVSAHRLTAVVPYGASTVTVTVTTTAKISTAAAFTYSTQPSITSVTPDTGPEGGGTTVTIEGSGLFVTVGKEQVKFGTSPAGSLTLHHLSATTLVVTSPSHPSGTVTVTVIDPHGTSNGFKYTFHKSPLVTLTSPTKVLTTGGNAVKVTGTNLSLVTKVTVAGTTVPFKVLSTYRLRITSVPAHVVGTASVVVSAPSGSAATSLTYATDSAHTPIILSITPTEGAPAGNYTMTIVGKYISTATTVTFGNTDVTPTHTAKTATVLTITVPAGAPHTSDQVRAKLPVGTPSPPYVFTYTT